MRSKSVGCTPMRRPSFSITATSGAPHLGRLQRLVESAAAEVVLHVDERLADDVAVGIGAEDGIEEAVEDREELRFDRRARRVVRALVQPRERDVGDEFAGSSMPQSGTRSMRRTFTGGAYRSSTCGFIISGRSV